MQNLGVNINSMEFSSDYIMVQNKDIYGLWEKYTALQMHYYKKIPMPIRHDIYEYGFDEFRQDCYIVCSKALEGIKLEKIKNPATFTFYIQLSQWLSNFISRDIIRDYVHGFAIKYSDYCSKDSDGDVTEWDPTGVTDIHSNFYELLDKLSPKDKEQAIKIMFHLPHGGRGISKEGEELFRKYYKEY